MKKGIHPKYHEIILVMKNGDEEEDGGQGINIKVLKTKSTAGQEGQRFELDIYPSIHPAWTKSLRSSGSRKTGKLARHIERYGDLF